MAVALDSSVVIGFLDRSDAFHGAADRSVREALNEGQGLYASAVTYAEVLTGAKLGHHDEAHVLGFFNDLISEVMPVDATVAERAADLRGRAKALRMPDALILAGADVSPDVDRIVCTDEIAEKVADLIDCEVQRLVS